MTVGVGKAHVAPALGNLFARRGGEVRFAKTSRLLAGLAGGHADRTWGARCVSTPSAVRRFRAAVPILDDIAPREHPAAQADDVDELISERAVHHRPLVPTDNRNPIGWCPLFPNAVVAVLSTPQTTRACRLDPTGRRPVEQTRRPTWRIAGWQPWGVSRR